MSVIPSPKLYGLLAEYDCAERLLAATRKLRRCGYEKLEPLTPIPLEELDELLGRHGRGVALATLLGGIVGGVSAFFLQYYASVVSYPIEVAGRPFNSWPSFIPITFEITVLFAALAGLFTAFLQNGFPAPYHPVFQAEIFQKRGERSFFLLVRADDGNFGLQEMRTHLENTDVLRIEEV